MTRSVPPNCYPAECAREVPFSCATFGADLRGLAVSELIWHESDRAAHVAAVEDRPTAPYLGRWLRQTGRQIVDGLPIEIELKVRAYPAVGGHRAEYVAIVRPA